MKKPYKIFLNNFELSAIIGVFPEERQERQPLWADIELQVKAGDINDNVENVPDYNTLSQSIEALAETLQPALIETLAEAIGELCLQHEGVVSATVHLAKPQALGGKAIPSVEVFVE